MAENTRAFYRVDYPVRERPVLRTASGDVEVIECSESGLRLVAAGGAITLAVGSAVRGVVHFGDRAEAEIEGVVVRLGDGDAAVRFTNHSIPFSIILGEQKYLRRHYHARYNR